MIVELLELDKETVVLILTEDQDMRIAEALLEGGALNVDGRLKEPAGDRVPRRVAAANPDFPNTVIT